MFDEAEDTFFQFFVIQHYTHPLPAKYIAWPDENGVTHLCSYFYCFICIVSRAIVWIRNVQFFQHITKATSIFGNVHVVVRCTNDLNAFLMQAGSEFQRRLSAKLHDHAFWFFQFYDLPEMLPEHRFEI